MNPLASSNGGVVSSSCVLTPENAVCGVVAASPEPLAPAGGALLYGLYIHVPFCRQKCHYCDFVSQPAPPETIVAYLKAVAAEMQSYRGLPVDTVYIGGGTPSLLSPAQVKDLFTVIYHTVDCSRLSEVTMEVNPESVDEEKLRAFLAAGGNRISFGAQSFSDSRLAALGRIHSAAVFENAFHTARQVNLKNCNIDLMYGLVGQDTEEWKQTLARAVVFHPEHLSLYPLTIEPGTVFAQRGMRVSEDMQADMYEWSLAYLEAQGYEHYEISNWALPGFSSKHNLIYWQNKEYLGLGAAAASYVERKRWKNCSNIEEYIRRVSDNGTSIAEEENIDEDRWLAEEMIMKLRCAAGVVLTPLLQQRYGDTIERLIGTNLLERKGQNICLTTRGLLLANQALREFV
jgi:oxygen-independent coproporphyrinogen-3 oxidase